MPLNAMACEKKELRRKILNTRRKISPFSRQVASKKILDTLTQLSRLRKASRVHCYVGQPDEPDTLPILEWLLKQEIQLAVPCVDSQNPELQHSQLSSIESLEKGNFGILDVPSNQRIDVDLTELELVLIPGIAFDLSGGRLGYGRGYYDRFLEKTGAFRIGVCFGAQMVDQVPMESHDKRMQALVSEQGYLEIER